MGKSTRFEWISYLFVYNYIKHVLVCYDQDILCIRINYNVYKSKFKI